MELNIGIVAHYYMDVDLQSMLHVVRQQQMDLLLWQKQWCTKDGIIGEDSGGGGIIAMPEHPLVSIADSLKIRSDAMWMCANGSATAIVCLEDDFMSRLVLALPGQNGHANPCTVPPPPIGCSILKSAKGGGGYHAWLSQCAGDALSDKRKALHVVHIAQHKGCELEHRNHHLMHEQQQHPPDNTPGKHIAWAGGIEGVLWSRHVHGGEPCVPPQCSAIVRVVRQQDTVQASPVPQLVDNMLSLGQHHHVPQVGVRGTPHVWRIGGGGHGAQVP